MTKKRAIHRELTEQEREKHWTQRPWTPRTPGGDFFVQEAAGTPSRPAREQEAGGGM